MFFYKLLFVFLVLFTGAYACGGPDKIQVALGHCPFTCQELCEDAGCTGVWFPQCSQIAYPDGTMCPGACTLDCKSGFGGGPAGPFEDQCI